jgi:TetR/AcrR family transcriptional regulator, transcriptional repressor of aconitase
MARTVNHEQKQLRREAITSAAAALFARRGFAETSTADIAKAAGISTGSLFYHFPDKAAIFRAIFEKDIPESRRLFEAHDETADPAESILEVVATLADAARDDLAPGLLVELLRRAGNDPLLMEIVVANEAIVQDGLASLVRRAATNGQVDGGLDPAAAATWIRKIVDAVYLNAGDDTGVDPIPMLRLIIARFLEIDTSSESTRRRKHRDTSE